MYVRIAVVADSMTPLRARQCGQAGSVLWAPACVRMSARRYASSLRPLCRALRPAAGCVSRLYTPRAARTHANARRRRVSRRAPALRPHLTHQISMRVRCAHNLGRDFFDIFGPPKICVGVGPSPGFAVLQHWFGRPRRRWPTRRRPKRRRRSLPPKLDVFGLRRTASDTCFCV